MKYMPAKPERNEVFQQIDFSTQSIHIKLSNMSFYRIMVKIILVEYEINQDGENIIRSSISK